MLLGVEKAGTLLAVSTFYSKETKVTEFFLIVSTLEMGVNNRRAVSTSESMRLRNLPPIKDHTRPGNRKVGTRTDTSVKEQPSWAKSWARRRAEQTNVHSKGCAANKGRNPILSPLTSTSLKSARQKTEVVAMNEKEAMLFKRLKGIYANSTDRAMRAQRLQNSISSLQTRTLHSELDCSLREYKRKQDEDVRNRSELKRLRDRFTKDRERRHRRSYVSINALECPRVSRHAYGLPEDGEEDTQSGVTHHAEQKLRDIWKNAMKRAALVDKMINVRTKNEIKLPEITVRRQSVSHKDPRTPSAEKNRREGNTAFLISFELFGDSYCVFSYPNPPPFHTEKWPWEILV